jgi:hypothetical protein
MQRWDDAGRHLENALVLNRRLGSPTWIAHTLYEHARLALGRYPEDRDPARERAFEALDIARRIGLHGLVARIESLTTSLPTSTTAADMWPRGTAEH